MQVIEQSFERVSAEAISYLSRLTDLSGEAGSFVQNQLAQIETARNFTGMNSITDKGLSDASDILEFMQIVKSLETYILPLRSSECFPCLHNAD